MRYILRALQYLVANRFGQYLLHLQMRSCQWLMGIGAGANVDASGEGAVMQKLVRENRSGLVIFDVGANCGQFLRLAVSRLEDRIQSIHSFEPAAATFDVLQETQPDHPGVVLNHLALGATSGKAELYYDAEKSALASLTKRDLAFRNIEFEQRETVTLSTLDAYCERKQVDHIDWLKLDVEGHEMDVLNGGVMMFAKRAVEMVTFEFGGCNVDTRVFLRDFCQFFEEQGMRLHRITPGGYFSHIQRYRESEEQFVPTNFVAWRSE